MLHQKTSKQDIARAVHDAIAGRIGSVARIVGLEDDVVMVGGMAHNVGFVESLKRDIGMEVKVPEDPDYVGALTLTLVPGTPLYDQYKKGEFKLVSPFQSLEELKVMIENSSFTNCFFSSMHASNYFSVRGTLPWEKERMLGELQAIIDKGDPQTLRPELLRGL